MVIEIFGSLVWVLEYCNKIAAQLHLPRERPTKVAFSSPWTASKGIDTFSDCIIKGYCCVDKIVTVVLFYLLRTRVYFYLFS